MKLFITKFSPGVSSLHCYVQTLSAAPCSHKPSMYKKNFGMFFHQVISFLASTFVSLKIKFTLCCRRHHIGQQWYTAYCTM